MCVFGGGCEKFAFGLKLVYPITAAAAATSKRNILMPVFLCRTWYFQNIGTLTARVLLFDSRFIIDVVYDFLIDYTNSNFKFQFNEFVLLVSLFIK